MNKKSLLNLLSILLFASLSPNTLASSETKKIRALLIVDVQKDFCEGGALGVPGAEDIISTINTLIEGKMGHYDAIIASQDWHPPHHGSFASSHHVDPFVVGTLGGRPQTMWPDHCVQNSKGAEFHAGLHINEKTGSKLSYTTTNSKGVRIYVQRKGSNPEYDSYSAFKDDGWKATGLMKYLQSKGVTDLDVCGLATDYCVGASALDAKTMNPSLTVRFLEYASRGISLEAIAKKIEEMQEKGILIVKE